MPVFSIDVPIVATAYIRAATAEEAERIASKQLHYAVLHAVATSGSEVLISGAAFDSPDLPEVSLSPAMSVYNPSEYAVTAVDEAPVVEQVSD